MTNRTHNWDEQRLQMLHELTFLCGAFLIGAVMGSFFASGFALEKDGWLAGVVLDLAASGPHLQSYVLFHSVLALLIFFGAFLRAGSILVPLAIAVKSFVMAAGVTCCIKLFGTRGYLPALSAIFFSAFIVVFSLILLACRTFELRLACKSRHAGAVLRNKQLLRGYFFSGVVVLFLLILSGLIHCRLLPYLTGWILQLIS